MDSIPDTASGPDSSYRNHDISHTSWQGLLVANHVCLLLHGIGARWQVRSSLSAFGYGPHTISKRIGAGVPVVLFLQVFQVRISLVLRDRSYS